MKIGLFAILLAALALASCSEKELTPREALAAYKQAHIDGDLDAVMQHFHGSGDDLQERPNRRGRRHRPRHDVRRRCVRDAT